jgi:hypothetical protein
MAKKWEGPDRGNVSDPKNVSGPRRTNQMSASRSSQERRLAEMPVGQINPIGLGNHEVIVSVNQVTLEEFSNMVYSMLASRVEVSGGSMTVTEEELKRYFVTAIYSRVRWVNFQPVGNFRPDAPWALPVPMHMVASAIGVVETQPSRRYVPVWNPDGDELVLSTAEWESCTRRLSALELLPDVELIHALEKDRSGLDVVMSLLHGTLDGQEYFYSNVPPHALECLIASVAGLAAATPIDIEGLPPQVIPIYHVSRTWIVGFMQDFVQLTG